jgi:hypothetical protein
METHTSAGQPLARVAAHQLAALMDAGWDAYAAQQFQRAADLYTRGAELAESLGDASSAIACRATGGDALMTVGRLRQALAMLSPVLQAQPPTSGQADYFNALLHYLSVAMQLPIALTVIERGLTQVEQFLSDAGRMAWRHKLLIQRATLCSMRGHYHEALQHAQESWACWQPLHPYLIADVHFSAVVDISQDLRDPDLMRRYLDEWQRQHDERPTYRERVLSLQQSWLARLEQRPSDALEWGRRALAAAERSDKLSSRVAAGEALIRALLCRADIADTQPILRRVLTARHTENAHLRYTIQLLRGDYHLAAARDAAGMAPADDALDRAGPPPRRIVRARIVRAALGRARRAYAAAMREGRRIDEHLGCTWRQERVARRLDRVAAIEERLG